MLKIEKKSHDKELIFFSRSDYWSAAPEAGAIAGAALRTILRSDFGSGAPKIEPERLLERRSEFFRSAEGLEKIQKYIRKTDDFYFLIVLYF